MKNRFTLTSDQCEETVTFLWRRGWYGSRNADYIGWRFFMPLQGHAGALFEHAHVL